MHFPPKRVSCSPVHDCGHGLVCSCGVCVITWWVGVPYIVHPHSDACVQTVLPRSCIYVSPGIL